MKKVKSSNKATSKVLFTPIVRGDDALQKGDSRQIQARVGGLMSVPHLSCIRAQRLAPRNYAGRTCLPHACLPLTFSMSLGITRINYGSNLGSRSKILHQWINQRDKRKRRKSTPSFRSGSATEGFLPWRPLGVTSAN